MLRISGQGSGSNRPICVAFGLLVVVAALLLAGCGNSSPSDSGSSSSSAPASAEPSKEFNNPEGVHGIEPVATFGTESSDSERREASAIVAESLAAREEAAFAAQCATLGKRGLESVFGIGNTIGNASECKLALEKLAKPLSGSKAFRVDTLTGEIAALRVKGNEGFALYHGNDGNDYEMPMEKEAGRWRVASIATLELPKTSTKSAKKAEGKKAKGL